MRISDVMTRCPYSIEAQTPPGEALAKMGLWGVRHLPVIKDERLIGVVTERDLQLTVLAGEISGYRPSVGELCTKEPYVVHVDNDLIDVSLQMAERKMDYALVDDPEGELIGIFTSTDACRVLYRLLAEHPT